MALDPRDTPCGDSYALGLPPGKHRAHDFRQAIPEPSKWKRIFFNHYPEKYLIEPNEFDPLELWCVKCGARY